MSLKFLLSVQLVFLFGSVAFSEPTPREVACSSVQEGADIGGKFETTVSFLPHSPSLIHTSVITFTGKSPSTKVSTFMSAKEVCGVKLDFAKACKWRESIDMKFGYGFTFQCGADITFGEFYCDEDCFTSKGGGATFRCEGPKVDKSFGAAGLPFGTCHYQEETPPRP